MRRGLTWLLAVSALLTSPAAAQSSLTGLISRDQAGRFGLVRAWAVQVAIGGGRDRVAGVVCAGDVVLVHTERGLVQLIDAERGITLWTRQIGERARNSYAPAVDARHVAVVSGRSAVLLDRTDGRELWSKAIEGVPSAGLGLGPQRVFVPTLRGRLVALPIDDPENEAWYFASSGSIEVAPLVTPTSVVWGTTTGLAFCSAQDKVKIRFQLHTRASISAPMAFRAPLIYIASQDEEVYAIDEQSGAERWRFATGSQVGEGPLAADDIVLVTPQAGDLYCLGAAQGETRWVARGPVRVASVSPERVYAVDSLGQLLILDRATGVALGRLATSRMAAPVTNAINDRVYLASASGLVQCLREAGLERPAPTQPAPPATGPGASDPASDDSDDER